MLQSFIVYGILTLSMLYLSYIGRAKSQWKYMVYAIALYALVFGVRYGVGVDFFNYMHNYLAYTTTSGGWSISQAFEPGFAFINKALSAFHAHYTVFFGVIAFLQVYFSFLAFKRESRLYPYLIFTFMVLAQWLTYSNGLRQIMAVSFWIWAIKFLAERKPWHYYIAVALAFSMHSSAIMLVIFYPLYHWKDCWIKNIKVQFVLLAISLVLMKVDIIQNLMQNIDTVIQMTRYDDYLQQEKATQIHSVAQIGVGFAVTLLTIILIILFSNKTRAFVKSRYFDVAYDLFIIGVCLKYIFINSMMFSRINYYFINLLFIIAAYTLHYAHHNNKPLFYTILGLITLTFLFVILNGDENTATYVFFWQKDLYYTK